MYNELVKDLLKKHFGGPRRSLRLGDAGRAGRRIYFYETENEKQISDLAETLGRLTAGKNFELPELTQKFSVKDMKDGQLPQCACFEESDGARWAVSFYDIVGVTYRRGRGGKTSAVLRLGNMPFVRLTEASCAFFGFWERSIFSRKNMMPTDREGFSYWVNKALKTSAHFRGFAADFFRAVGDAERLQILKDAADAITSCGCFLPLVSYDELIRYGTAEEYLRTVPTASPVLCGGLAMTDLNVGYVIRMISHLIDENDIPKLLTLGARTVSDALTLPLFYDEFSAEEFLTRYYRAEFEKLGLDASLADYYVSLCFNTGRKFRLGCGRGTYLGIFDEMKTR